VLNKVARDSAMLDAFKTGAFKIGTFTDGPGHVAALDRVQAWTRARFKLAEDDVVSVSQVSCVVPGCPPLETVVAFWTTGETRHHFKIFKPVVEVVEDDLPPGWMKGALAATIEGCECC
jgi:hypothetical protein